jgi:hypothetical protein
MIRKWVSNAPPPDHQTTEPRSQNLILFNVKLRQWLRWSRGAEAMPGAVSTGQHSGAAGGELHASLSSRVSLSGLHSAAGRGSLSGGTEPAYPGEQASERNCSYGPLYATSPCVGCGNLALTMLNGAGRINSGRRSEQLTNQ